MAGTKAGGQKAAQRNLASDPLFYEKIGSKGGKNGQGPAYRKGGDRASGFAANPDLARIAGKKGGSISRRRHLVEA